MAAAHPAIQECAHLHPVVRPALDLVLWLHEGAKTIPYEVVAFALILILNAELVRFYPGTSDVYVFSYG